MYQPQQGQLGQTHLTLADQLSEELRLLMLHDAVSPPSAEGVSSAEASLGGYYTDHLNHCAAFVLSQ